MTISTLTSKGQTTIPKRVRDYLRLRTGDRMDWQLDEKGNVLVVPKTKKPAEVYGILASRTKVKSTIAEMDEAVAQAFRKGKL